MSFYVHFLSIYLYHLPTVLSLHTQLVLTNLMEMVYIYLYKYKNVCLSVCSPFSGPIRHRLGYLLAQNCFCFWEGLNTNKLQEAPLIRYLPFIELDGLKKEHVPDTDLSDIVVHGGYQIKDGSLHGHRQTLGVTS